MLVHLDKNNISATCQSNWTTVCDVCYVLSLVLNSAKWRVLYIWWPRRDKIILLPSFNRQYLKPMQHSWFFGSGNNNDAWVSGAVCKMGQRLCWDKKFVDLLLTWHQWLWLKWAHLRGNQFVPILYFWCWKITTHRFINQIQSIQWVKSVTV